MLVSLWLDVAPRQLRALGKVAITQLCLSGRHRVRDSSNNDRFRNAVDIEWVATPYHQIGDSSFCRESGLAAKNVSWCRGH